MKNNNIHHFMKPLIAINICIILAAQFLLPLWGSLASHVGGDLRSAGIAISIFSIVFGVFILVAGIIEQKLRNEKSIMVATGFLISICYLAYFIINRPWQLYLLQTLLAFFGSFQCVAIFSLYNKYMPKSHSAYNWGIWNSFYFFASGIAALLAGYTTHLFGFKGVFVVMFLISLASLVLTLLIMPKIRKFETSLTSP